MAKLKKRSVQRVVCPTCKGNGFLKIIFDTNDTNIYQCWDCDSEGEFYVYESKTIQSNYTIDPATGDVVKLN
tara:strand:+ start:27 stop:242 length:216 start_codon:yes stop_codon:yes gene_type:complete